MMKYKENVYLLLCLILTCLQTTDGEPCFKNTTTCVSVSASMCLTTKITFDHTSLIYTNGSMTQDEINNQLGAWTHLQGVPECWNIIQPFLCSVYLPKCDADKQRVEMPNRELCERVRAPCEVVKRHNGSWPWFLDCDQWFYAESCGQTVYETSNFDTTGKCSSPLISTIDESNWYESIKGCGLECENPLYTSYEHKVTSIFVAVLAGVCLTSSLFTLVTFVLDWKVARKYPAVILFYINGCFFIATLGWLVQFFVPDDVPCRKDGTIRTGEPLIGSGETASCTVVFMMIYYFTMSGVVWFVMLGYAWDIHFKALGTVRDDLSRKTAYFHIISWCLPLVLTIVCLSTSVIDADSLSGVCFPGFTNTWVRAGYVLAPICIALVLGTVFSVRGLQTLRKVKKDSPPFIGEKATAKIHDTIIRLGVFIIITFMLVLISMCVHIYNFTNVSTWDDHLMDFTFCQANVSVMQILENAAPSSCVMENRPSIVAAMFHIFAFFGASLAFSSWSWTRASTDVWRRTWYRICNKPVNRPQKLRKHRLTARTFKRQKQRSNERLSISYGTEHDDPVGMRFDRSSMSSHSRSSGFAVSVPKHSHRLRGVLPRHLRRAHRRHSDSDALSTGSHPDGTRTSRRPSYESSMSQKLSDIEREIREEERRKRRKKKRKKRQNRIQPILEPISSNMAAINAHKLRHGRLRDRHRHKSDSSDVSKTSAQCVNLGLEKNHFPLQSMGSSNILSDSVITGNSNSISEIELPQTKQKLPDFSIFTAASALPRIESKEDNSYVTNTTNLKGANPSPSGSVRRGRRREVKLEMTETSFYQEDEENIEMGGNQTIHAEENCHEVGEVRGNLKELGPLVNEIFEQARANSTSGRSSKQRDPMGSGRLGSASSRGSRSSRGSQANSKDLKYATAKVHLPPERPRTDSDRTNRKRPFSGDYILAARRNNAKREETARKSQSQPGSRVSSATSAHKRQIGQNGRMDFQDGLSWSRFLQSKGYNAGPLFGPVGMEQPQQKYQSDLFNAHLLPGMGQKVQMPFTDKGQDPYYNQMPLHNTHMQHQTNQNYPNNPQVQNQGPYPGQLQIMDKTPLKNNTEIPKNSNVKPSVDVLNVEKEHKKLYEIKRPYTNPYRKHRDPTEGDVLGNESDVDSPKANQAYDSENGVETAREDSNILNVEEEHCQQCGYHRNLSGNVNVLDIAAEQTRKPGRERNRKIDKTNDLKGAKKAIVNVDILNIEAEQSKSDNNDQVNQKTTRLEQEENSLSKSPIHLSPKHLKSEIVTENENEAKVINGVLGHTTKPKSPVVAKEQQNKDHRHINTVLNQGKLLDVGHKISAFDGKGPKKEVKVPQTNYALKDLKDQSQHISAVVLSKPVTDLKSKHGVKDEMFVGPNLGSHRILQGHLAKQNGFVNGKETKTIQLKGKQAIKEVPKSVPNDPILEAGEKNVLVPPRRKLGSDGTGSSGSRSLSAITRSSGTSRNSDNSRHSNMDNAKPPNSGTLNLGFINENYNIGKPKEKSSSKSKVVPERSVGMFDFVDCDNFESDYDDVSTDNLTDTYTYTDYDDDLTEVSSLPC